MGRRGWIVGGLAMLPLFAACGSSQSGSGGSCVGPYVDDQPPTGTYGVAPPTVNPGAALTLHGHWFISDCDDTGGQLSRKPLPPTRLTVSLPGGSVLRLGPFNPAGKDMGFTATMQLPAHTPAGTATVSDDRHSAPIYRFTIGRA